MRNGSRISESFIRNRKRRIRSAHKPLQDKLRAMTLDQSKENQLENEVDENLNYSIEKEVFEMQNFFSRYSLFFLFSTSVFFLVGLFESSAIESFVYGCICFHSCVSLMDIHTHLHRQPKFRRYLIIGTIFIFYIVYASLLGLIWMFEKKEYIQIGRAFFLILGFISFIVGYVRFIRSLPKDLMKKSNNLAVSIVVAVIILVSKALLFPPKDTVQKNHVPLEGSSEIKE